MKNNNFWKKLKEWWKVPKYKAAIKLGIYVFVMLIICIILSIGTRMGSNAPQNNPPIEEKTKTYLELKEELLQGNYEYKYIVTKNEDKIFFSGLCTNHICTGYKETKKENIKYTIEGSNFYKIVLDEKEIYDGLYDGLEAQYLNVNSLFELVNSLEVIKGLKDEYFTYYYVMDSSNITIYYDKNNISKVEINTSDSNYLLEFTNINGEKKA